MSIWRGASVSICTIRSELPFCTEPTSGDLAHIRLVGSRNVKMYPGSTCVSYEVPGSDYPAGPQMGGQRKRDLGMPKSAETPKHYVEIAASAGQPISAAFSFYRESSMPGTPGTGAPGTRSSANCYAAGSFVPQVGRNYEVVSHWVAGDCAVQVYELVQEPDGLRRAKVESRARAGCSHTSRARNCVARGSRGVEDQSPPPPPGGLRTASSRSFRSQRSSAR